MGVQLRPKSSLGVEGDKSGRGALREPGEVLEVDLVLPGRQDLEPDPRAVRQKLSATRPTTRQLRYMAPTEIYRG
jgi:hypothetical protein